VEPATTSVTDLKRFYEELPDDVAKAVVKATYRRARSVVKEEFTIPLEVLQLKEYRDQLRAITHGFTARSNVSEREVPT
jgi:hypothetical protein